MATYEEGYDPKYGYNRNAFAHNPPHLKFIGGLVSGLAAPIALASEAIAQNKNKKKQVSPAQAAEQGNEEATTPQPEINETRRESQEAEDAPANDDDEADWTLDELAAAATNTPEAQADAELNDQSMNPDIRSLISSIQANTAPPATAPTRLPFPVILPQRRPGTKTRGFVRAYAPVLENSGIPQSTFLAFLKSFHTASQASPIFDIIVLAANIAAFYPNGIAQAVSVAVQAAAKVGQEMQERWRTNVFLDQANRDVFMPRGLYALVVAYKPTIGEGHVERRTVDVGAMAMARYGGSLGSADDDVEGRSELQEKMQRLRVSSAKTHGEREMPVACAPLIYPALDGATDRGADVNKVRALVANTKGAGKFVQEYYDKRAQAVFNADNSSSTLAGMQPAPTFASGMGDPLDARNTHLITLLTGGKIKAEPLGARRRWERAQRMTAERRERGLEVKSVRRGLKEDVLYLMVVNMPTDRELEVAKEELRRRRGER